MKTWHVTAGAVAASAALVAGVLGASAQEPAPPDAAGHTLYWSPATGAHSIEGNGAIGRKFVAAGFERGYGYPVTDEIRYVAQVHQRFSNGYVVNWSSVTKRTWVTR